VASAATLTVRGHASVAAEPDAAELGLILTTFSERADEAEVAAALDVTFELGAEDG
jgi:uncharacterized protein YggE